MRVVGALVAILVVVVAVGVALFLGRTPGAASVAPGSMRPASVPRFVEEAAAARVTHAYTGGFDYYVGGGVATFDCNGDRFADLYFAGGATRAGMFRNASERGGPLRFERVASDETDLESVTGAYPLDVDSDGLTDLAVLRRGENVLLRGLGECQFERANEAWSFDGGSDWSTAFSARWNPGQDWPTLAIGNYLASSDPSQRACSDNEVFQPSSSDDAFASPVALTPGWCTLSILFSDWNRSGARDLRVSNDRHYYGETSAGQEQLWRISAAGPPSEYTAEDGWRTLRIFGMGIAGYDLTGDGYPEYYLTNQGDNKLQTLAEGPGRPIYDDIALRRGVTAHRPYTGDTSLPSTAWHDQFEDVNNDDLIDLFIAKGNVEAMADYAARDPSNLLIGQADGTFREAAPDAEIVSFARARGGALADLNLDGLLDLVVVNRIENVAIHRNVGAGTAEQPAPLGNWVSVSVHQAGANRNGIGSWIEVRAAGRTQLREVIVGGGHVSGQLGPHHFGLGGSTSAEVRVTWPDGEVGPWLPTVANQSVVVERGAAQVRAVQ